MLDCTSTDIRILQYNLTVNMFDRKWKILKLRTDLTFWCKEYATTWSRLSTIYIYHLEWVPGENPRPPQVTGKIYHIMLYRVHLAGAGFELTTLVMIDTDYIRSYKSNYHMINTTTAPLLIQHWSNSTRLTQYTTYANAFVYPLLQFINNVIIIKTNVNFRPT